MFDFTPLTEVQAQQLNVQVLAFVGDSVYTLYVRTQISKDSRSKSGGLHLIANNIVSATGQSKVVTVLEGLYNLQELAIYKRARNYKTVSVAKNASVVDYRRATGFEAVLGYLYLTGQTERLNYVLNTSFDIIKKD